MRNQLESAIDVLGMPSVAGSTVVYRRLAELLEVLQDIAIQPVVLARRPVAHQRDDRAPQIVDARRRGLVVACRFLSDLGQRQYREPRRTARLRILELGGRIVWPRVVCRSSNGAVILIV